MPAPATSIITTHTCPAGSTQGTTVAMAIGTGGVMASTTIIIIIITTMTMMALVSTDPQLALLSTDPQLALLSTDPQHVHTLQQHLFPHPLAEVGAAGAAAGAQHRSAHHGVGPAPTGVAAVAGAGALTVQAPPGAGPAV
jgi:hypothetical protein